jgi:hypothetical protein
LTSNSSSKRIVVLFHEQDRHLPAHRYIVYYLADFWRSDGHQVDFLYGTRSRPPADLILVHVNLSVVPPEYLAFAAAYPIALNASVSDIRKSKVSANLVGPEDDWEGPVIVKSDLNYGGIPEQMLARSWLARRWKLAHRLRVGLERRRGQASPYSNPGDYEIYGSYSQVPASRKENPQLVIERFLPELEGELYCTRVYQFLGDRWSCTRMGSRNPIVKANESVLVESVEPHPAVLAWREALKMDYGKLDYVVHDGEAVLIDANKTIGASLYAGTGGSTSQAEISARRRLLAEGLYSYF